MVEVVWRKLALKQLNEAYTFIKKDSLPAAEKVRDEIFDKAEALKLNPEIYPIDKYRKDNDGSVRAFEVYHYRIAYQITKSQIRILIVRHSKREPFKY
ncbi:type II toxin-antitoxin system RelE/ParE family toxin [Galbibacter sp. BG1]|uniref:type II toxin-antitoxin system RelE/ParE family toxin n=1 Tax=Galbibacter sp. BG1 TaxID=1170699 RepID=UPI0015BA1CF2|nr:type II toxin-antitoxin system RelE/ParE family toxin [Galbibacter sp. BG1]QLE00820.1 type II toxin-antitoxin system RelE/ParE family toxin [Galbibacter sp. BG1]